MTRSTDSRGVRWLGVAACAAVVCAVSLVAGARPARAGSNVWTSLGPPGEYIHALAIDPVTPQTLYAGGFHGVLKSTDAGATWAATNAGLPDYDVYALAIDPSTPRTLYAGAAGAFKSTDAGATWSATGLTKANSDSVFALAIDPITPRTLYVGTGSGGVFKSTDAGATWGAALPVSGGALAIDPMTPGTLYAGDIALGYPQGVYKSTDAGGTWSAADTRIPPHTLVPVLAIDPITSRTLYAGTISSGVFKSTDANETWSATGLTSISVFALAVDPIVPRTLYAGTVSSGVFKSTDGGDTWNSLNTGLTNKDVLALAIDPIEPRRVYAGTAYGGVFAIEADGCTDTPSAGCRKPTKSGAGVFQLKHTPGDDAKDALRWTWSKGEATALSDLGDPVSGGTAYRLCVYDSTPSLVMSADMAEGGTCAGKPCWSATRTGFKYKNKEVTPDGILQLQLRAGAAGKAKIQVTGKRANLRMPTLPLTQAPTVVAQLKNSNGTCWEADFSAPAKRNDTAQFSDKSD